LLVRLLRLGLEGIILLREVTEGHYDDRGEDLRHGRINMPALHEQLDEDIVQQQTDDHQHEIAEQLHPSLQRGFREDDIPHQKEPCGKADAESHDDGGDIRLEDHKAKIHILLVQNEIIADGESKDVDKNIGPAAGRIPEGLQGHDPPENGVEKINKGYDPLFRHLILNIAPNILKTGVFLAATSLLLQPISRKMDITSQIRTVTAQALLDLFQYTIAPENILVNETKPEFKGDYTVVLFSFIKELKKSPEALGNELGQFLVKEHSGFLSDFNVIKGFLNLSITDGYWAHFLGMQCDNAEFGRKEKNGQKVMVEYSSPNTNKPLHLGHLRNNFLGWSVAEIFKANGYDIVKTCIANDRGIHICKSMIAWQLFANGATPASTGIKGDHFVGDYYVLFNTEYKSQVEELVAAGMDKEQAEKQAPIMKGAQQMLVDWEAGKPEVIALWKTMNSWVYAGFDVTYKRIGSDFDKTYYESETYLLGKQLVEYGLGKGVFLKKEDGSVWIDLTADGLDQKIVQRKDGTAVYITQDIGLAVNKYEEYHAGLSVYVVGDEQNYHFKVLKLICQKLGLPSADGIFHLSYGMVELPNGRMKAREGTVVDADDILDEMIKESEKKTIEQGKTEGFNAPELKELYETIGLGGLKFFLLRVDPKKRMLFNPEESIDLHGFTATFIQYAHARIRSILRKEAAAPDPSDPIAAVSGNPTSDPAPATSSATVSGHSTSGAGSSAPTATQSSGLFPLERALIIALEKYPSVIAQAGVEMNPSVIAGYAFALAKTFNSFYSEHSIGNAETPEKKQLRLQSARLTATVLQSAMALLGIRVPERM